MPLHELVDRLEATYLQWRFEDRGSALEGSLHHQLVRLVDEVGRRRRRALTGRCVCEVCFAIRTSFDLDELL
jgi:hypothetical protein